MNIFHVRRQDKINVNSNLILPISVIFMSHYMYGFNDHASYGTMGGNYWEKPSKKSNKFDLMGTLGIFV